MITDIAYNVAKRIAVKEIIQKELFYYFNKDNNNKKMCILRKKGDWNMFMTWWQNIVYDELKEF